MNKYQTLAANTILMSAGTFGSKLMVFLMVRFYTGYLTPGQYGTADILTQTANLLIPLVSMDITDAVFRFAANQKNGRVDVFSVGVRTIGIGSVGMILIIVFLQKIPAVQEYGGLIASFVIASCVHALCAHFVRAQGNTVLFAWQGILNTALFIGANVLFLAVLGWGIRGYVLSTTVANIITAIMLIRKAKLWRYIRFNVAHDLQRQMFCYCIPLIPTAIFWWIIGVSDRYMVKYFLGSDANGLYAVAYKIPTILTILASVFMNAWQLSAIAESNGNRQAHVRFYGKIWNAFISAVFAGAGGIIALSPILIHILADEPYYDAWRYIPILTLSMAASAFSDFMGSVYVVTKKSSASFWTSMLGAAINIILNICFIPYIGIQGAAIATLVSCMIIFMIRLVNTRSLLPFRLSGKKLTAGIGVLAVQTAFILLRWPGWVIIQIIGPVILTLFGVPAVLSTIKVIFNRK